MSRERVLLLLLLSGRGRFIFFIIVAVIFWEVMEEFRCGSIVLRHYVCVCVCGYVVFA